MADTRRAVVIDALLRLGFRPRPWDGVHELDGLRMDAGPQTIYRHAQSDTFFTFPNRARPTVPAVELASIRNIAVGRGAATERAFDRAMAAAATTPLAKPPRQRRSRPVPVR